MLNAIINGKNIKEFINSLSAFITEAIIDINETGISSKAIDQSGVALVEAYLSASAFVPKTYTATMSKIGVPLSRIRKVMDLVDDDDIVLINLNKKTQTLDIATGGMTHNITLIDINSIKKPVQVAIPKNPTIVTLRGVHLKRAFKAAGDISEYTYIIVKKNHFIIKATGTLSKVTSNLHGHKLIDIKSNSPKIKILFSLIYLTSVASILSDKSNVILEIAEGCPLKINTTIANGTGGITYYIAPRVENEQ